MITKKKIAALGTALALSVAGLGLGVLPATLNAGSSAQAAVVTASHTFTPTADTYVQADRPTENFGSSVRWSAEGRANIWRNALVRFNAVIPTGETIVSAKFRAYSEAAATSTEFVDIYNVAGTWSEANVTWNNAPVRGTWLGKQGGFANGQWVEWDVTANIGDGGFTNFKLETNAQKWLGFKSAEATDQTLRPQLVVTTEKTVADPTPTATTTPTTPPTTTPAPDPTTPAPTPTSTPENPDGVTAAVANNWGPVVRGDEFNYTGALDPLKWEVYGDYAGHNGQGQRLQAKSTVNGSAYRIDGDAAGNTGGASAKYDRGLSPYYRVESRMRTSVRDPEYHPVMLLWADNVDGGTTISGVPEIDYAEGTSVTDSIKFFLHFGDQQTTSSKVLDTTAWHNYAVEWSSTAVVGYIDGVEWFRDANTAHIPSTPMHSTIQFDWFPGDSAATSPAPSWMETDWTREYNLTPAPTTPPTTPAPTTPPPTTPAPTTPPASTEDWDIAAVGDMNGVSTTSTSSASGKNAAAIKAALDAGTVDNFLGLGDFQYDVGSCSSTSTSGYRFWDGLWGGVKSKTYWTAAPNHDYEPGRNEDLDNYMDGQCVSTSKSATSTDPTRQGPNPAGTFQTNREWYSVDKGNWHLLIASSAIWRYDVARANAQTGEMDANLAAARAAGKHLAVILHEPYFGSTTSAHGRELESKPWIDVFYKNKVKVLFSGSQHNYERTCPINNNDVCVADGMQMFQVSTGGIGLRTFSNTQPSYTQKRFTGTWGWLQMSLKANGSYTWQFNPTSGTLTNTDSGSRQ